MDFNGGHAWRVEELTTSGWSVQDPKRDVKLSRENATARLNFYLGEGVSPDLSLIHI